MAVVVSSLRRKVRTLMSRSVPERLTRRRAGLAPFCGATLVRGTVRTAAVDYTVYVDPDRRRIVYWEQYDMDGGAA